MKIETYFDHTYKPVFEDILFMYFVPLSTLPSQHSSSINDVFSYYILDDQQTYNLNSWPFLFYNKTEIENTVVDINDKQLFEINESVFLLKYEVKNPGHTLMNILYQIQYYFLANFKCKIVVPIELLEISIFIESIIYLFFNKDDLIIINSKLLYKIKKIYFNLTCGYTQPHGNIEFDIYNLKIKNINLNDDIGCISYINKELIYDKSAIEHFLCNKIKLYFDANRFIQPIKYKKLCLIKNTDNIKDCHININYSLSRSYDTSYINFFKENEFNILNPGNYNVFDLFYLLNNCELLVLSWGCMSYMNKLIINNPNVKTLIISHVGYTHEFKFLPFCSQVQPCKNVKLIYNLKSELDESSKILIKHELDLLEKIIID